MIIMYVQSGLNSEVDLARVNQAPVLHVSMHQVRIAVIKESII